MAWPSTISGTLTSGIAGQGTTATTIRWGSGELVTKIGGATGATGTALSVSVGIVLRFNQKSIVDNIKLPNGDGLTSTRVQIVDGVQWDVTMRDDTGITLRPAIGTVCQIVDGAGMLGAVGVAYNATVVETGFDTAPKQPGELTFTVENLTNITEP